MNAAHMEFIALFVKRCKMKNSLDIRTISDLKMQHLWKQRNKRLDFAILSFVLHLVLFFSLWFSQLGIEKCFWKSTQNIVNYKC